jgi:predicted PurR-regulated permease PerM
MKIIKYEISQKNILNIFLYVLGAMLLWKLKAVLLLFFFCLLLMEILHPVVAWLETHKIKRSLAIILVYIIFIAFISFSFASLIPIFIAQTNGFIQAFPSILRNLNNIKIFGNVPLDFSNGNLAIFNNLPGNVTKTAVSIFSNLFSFILILVVTYYLLLERVNVERYFGRFFGSVGIKKSHEFMEILEKRLGHWVNAQLLLCFIVGILSYIGYTLIGLSYALPLAIIAGILELLPNIGPTIIAIVAGIVGLTISPITALLALVVGLIVNQLENIYIVPKVMKNNIGLQPVLTIFILAIGAKLGGLGGAVLALPTYLTLESIYKTFIQK